MFGNFLAQYRQTGVSLRPPGRAAAGRAAGQRWSSTTRSTCAARCRPCRPGAARRRPPGHAGSARPDLPLSRHGARHRGRRPAPGARLVHGDHRAHRRGQDHAAARAARPAAARRRARSAGTARRWPTRPPSSCRRAAPTRRRCRACSARRCATTSCSACRRTRWTCRARCTLPCWSATWPTLERGLDTRVGPRGVRLSGGQVQRAAAARMFVRAPELLVVRRPLQRARRGDRAAALGARCSPGRDTDLPGRLAPPRRPAPRRPDHRAARTAAWRPRARWTTCWRPRRRCSGSGMGSGRSRPTRRRVSAGNGKREA